jgi:hypothetical protein
MDRQEDGVDRSLTDDADRIGHGVAMYDREDSAAGGIDPLALDRGQDCRDGKAIGTV